MATNSDASLPGTTSNHKQDFKGDETSTLTISRPMLLLGILVLTGLIVFVVVHVGDVAIFLLDSGTLWAMMHVAGAPIRIPTAFVAIVIAFIAGTVSFLPGGIGGFETGAVTTLTLLGSSIEVGLAGTLLFRGLTLWLPLVPGLMLARQDIKIKL